MGVTYYLTSENILKLLKQLKSISPKGSSIIFDYPDQYFLTSTVERVQNTLKGTISNNEPMKSSFSYQQLEKILDQAGLLIYDLLTPKEIQNRYFNNRQDYLQAFEHINYVLAVFQ